MITATARGSGERGAPEQPDRERTPRTRTLRVPAFNIVIRPWNGPPLLHLLPLSERSYKRIQNFNVYVNLNLNLSLVFGWITSGPSGRRFGAGWNSTIPHRHWQGRCWRITRIPLSWILLHLPPDCVGRLLAVAGSLGTFSPLVGNLHPVLFAHFRGPGHSGLFQPFCLLREDLLLDTVCGR